MMASLQILSPLSPQINICRRMDKHGFDHMDNYYCNTGFKHLGICKGSEESEMNIGEAFK